MIENSSYISLQSYINNSNIVAVSKYRPSINTLCNIEIDASCELKEVPMRYYDKNRSSRYRTIIGEYDNKYNRQANLDHSLYTKYILDISINPKSSMIKRYEDISNYNNLLNLNTSGKTIDELIASSYINIIINTMKRFNYIMDNSCNIIHSGYGENIFENKKRKSRTKLGKLLYDLSEYYYEQADDEQTDTIKDVRNWMDLSTMKFDVSKLTVDNINIEKIKQHYQKKIENKTLYWVPIIRTVKNPKRPVKVYANMSNRQSYRYKHMKYKNKIVNADVFNSFNNKQFYLPLKTYVYAEYDKEGIPTYTDQDAIFKNVLSDPSIHCIKPIAVDVSIITEQQEGENVSVKKVAETINTSLDILEMVFGKETPLLSKTSNDTIKYIYENNFTFHTIYDISNDQCVVSNNTDKFIERCAYGFANRNLLRFRTYDSSADIVIPPNKFKKLFKTIKRCTNIVNKPIERSMYTVYFDLGIAIVDKNGRQYKTSGKAKKISLNILNDNQYILPRYINQDIKNYINNCKISDISINKNIKDVSFIKWGTVFNNDASYYAWSELNVKNDYTLQNYKGTHSVYNNVMDMSYDKVAQKTDGLAMIPTAQQMQKIVTNFNDNNENKFRLFVNDSNICVGDNNNVLFTFNKLYDTHGNDENENENTNDNNENNDIITINFWTRTLYDSENAYVIAFDIKDENAIYDIYMNILPLYKAARILPVIQEKTCTLYNVSIGGDDVTSIVLNKSTLNMKTWQIEKLIVTIKPNKADKSVTWISSDKSILDVDEFGNVKALSRNDASAKITVKSNKNGASYSCDINVSSYAKTFTGKETDRRESPYIFSDVENFVQMDETGVLWAKYNLGVDPDKLDTLDDYMGYKFAWGENMYKSKYTQENYNPVNPNADYLTTDKVTYTEKRIIIPGVKPIYNLVPSWRSKDVIDDPVSYMIDAHIFTDSKLDNFVGYNVYRVPTIDDFKNLLAYNDKEYIDENGITGIKFTSRRFADEGRSIFIPLENGNLFMSTNYWTNQRSNYYAFNNKRIIIGNILKNNVSGNLYTNMPLYTGMYIRPVVQLYLHAEKTVTKNARL